MSHDTDKALIRAKDIGLVIGILTLCGMVWAIYAKPAQWDQASRDVQDLKPRVERHDIQLAVIASQYDTIESELRSINRKLGR